MDIKRNQELYLVGGDNSADFDGKMYRTLNDIKNDIDCGDIDSEDVVVYKIKILFIKILDIGAIEFDPKWTSLGKDKPND